MLPFGCSTTPIPLISQDKLRFFAEDERLAELVVDLGEIPTKEMAEAISSKVRYLEENRTILSEYIAKGHERNFRLTLENLDRIGEELGGGIRH